MHLISIRPINIDAGMTSQQENKLSQETLWQRLEHTSIRQAMGTIITVQLKYMYTEV